MKYRTGIFILVFLAAAIGLYLVKRPPGASPSTSAIPEKAGEAGAPSAGPEEDASSMVLGGPSPSAPPSTPPPAGKPQAGIDPAILGKWQTEEGYTMEDIAEAQAVMRSEGIPEDRLNDPGLVRRYLLPRVVTSVQIKEFKLAESARAGNPIPFQLKGEVPAPEFHFVRYDITRQGDIIRPRALGHSPALDGNAAVASKMLPVALEGELEPLPPGNYRIIIPEMGVDGMIPLVVE